MEDEAFESEEKASWWPFVLIVFAVFVLWIGSPFLIERIVVGWDFQKLGVFGDSFGAVNALFSGLAFTGLFYAILLQRRELKLQREELRQTRTELRGQKEQAIAQNATLAQQTFDNTFFQLLRLHNDIVNSIDLFNETTGKETRGRDCFRVFYSRFNGRWNQNLPEDQFSTELDRVARTYKNFYPQIEAELGHYFRSLFNIVKFIDASTIKNKRLYTNLVRAQLSSYELLMLFYNCLSDLGSEKFRPFVEEYALLKMVPLKLLINAPVQKDLYSERAYSRPT